MKIITEKDFFQCSGGMMPSPFQSKQLIVKQKAQEKYITIQDTSTISSVDFGCKKMMLLLAVIAALIAVAIALIVATGGAALIAIGAAAGAAGAAIGAVAGTLICGHQAAAARKWLGNKSDFKILGLETITGNHVIQCDAFAFLGMQPEVITYAPNIKSWSQAISMGAASFVANVLEGAMIGMMIGASAVALPAIIEGGTAAFLQGGALNVLRFLGTNAIRNYAGTWLTVEGLALRDVMAVQSLLAAHGQKGFVTTDDVVHSIFCMEYGTMQSLQNITNGNGKVLDVIGLALWFTPIKDIIKPTEGMKQAEPPEDFNNKEYNKFSEDMKQAEPPEDFNNKEYKDFNKSTEEPNRENRNKQNDDSNNNRKDNNDNSESNENEKQKEEIINPESNTSQTTNDLGGSDGEAFEKGASTEIADVPVKPVQSDVASIKSRLTTLKKPARLILEGEEIPFSGKQTRVLGGGRFEGVVEGTYGDPITKYIWTIDADGINIGLEQTPIGNNRAIKHTNLSSKAYSGGELWFIDQNTVHINAWSGRFGAGAKMTAAEWQASIDAFKANGYEVIVHPYNP